PMTAHWGIEDPAAIEGADIQKEAAFVAAFRYMKNRISAFPLWSRRMVHRARAHHGIAGRDTRGGRCACAEEPHHKIWPKIKRCRELCGGDSFYRHRLPFQAIVGSGSVPSLKMARYRR